MKPYIYNCIIKRVVDGDTIDVDIDLGFDVWMKKKRVRVAGIDAPETRTKDPIEKAAGLYCKKRVIQLLPQLSRTKLVVATNKPDKYGRILGDFAIAEESIPDEIHWYCNDNPTLTEILLHENLAVTYDGKSKEDIRDQHQFNYNILLDNGLI
jgi:micrococcal nuclease|tara:strand:- start:295 stop:753 length:459 start_codon:yes stop_codon:yes gene_type:complete